MEERVGVGFPAAWVSAGLPVDLGPKSLLICAELSSGGILFFSSSIIGGCRWGEVGAGPRCRDGSGAISLPSHPSMPPAASRGLSLPLLLSPWVLGPLRCSQNHPLMSPRGSRAGLAPAAGAVVSRLQLLHRFQVKPPHGQCHVRESLHFLGC